ncbi:cation:proton antiporter [Lyngbya sp. CCY1209]|uniref:cation:proton antiporter n=1 Tax=Lyngbya sp. CCY1209 TaxID=2886103 RepID=UPI002D207A43|nr:cation:proton antiporter [Lyngbya sp. CCY1209]MEB3883838.1 cation:proton antiporter [Lyngbya sp. CCY1209]
MSIAIAIDRAVIPILNGQLGWLPNPLLLTETVAEEGYEDAVIASLVATVIVIFVVSRLLEELCVRVGLPAVLGDLLAGIVLGASALGFLIFAEVGGEVNPSILNFLGAVTGASPEAVTKAYDFQMEALIDRTATSGLLVLLFVTGLESDLGELIRVGGQAATVACSGVAIPFVLGSLMLIYVFHIATIPALFAGAALTATSIGITAKVMQDIGVLKSKEGQIILGAAILDDILGIVVLAVMLSLVATGTVEIATIASLLFSATLFVLGAVLLNRYFAPIFEAIADRFKSPGALMTLAVLFLALLSLLGVAAKLEAILGAFAAGIVLAGTNKRDELQQLFQPFVYIQTTVFFVTVGAKVDLSVINPLNPENREGLIIAAILIAIAIVGKVAAGFVVISKEKISRLAIGTGMIPRGEVGLVFAGLGSATGALPKSLDAAIIIMVIVTTLIAPILLRFVFPKSEEVTQTEAIT